MTTTVDRAGLIDGQVRPGYEPVREAFLENFARRGELGGAVAVYRHGERVVDLWGGIRDRATRAPWRADTMVLVYSSTKGLSAMALAVAHSRGWLDYDERVCTYWPEFGQASKERITVRHLLAHQAGLFGFDEPVDWTVVADLDRLAGIMARQRPEWPAGERQAYHGISLGFYQGELLRRIDPAHRTIGAFFAEEIAAPLGLDAYIRLPASIPVDRLAPLEPPSKRDMVRMPLGMPIGLLLDSFRHHSVFYRALVDNPGTGIPRDPDLVYVRDFEVPSGGAVASADGIAHAYGAFAAGGGPLGLRPETLRALEAPAVPPVRGFHDECLKGEVQFSLGFMKACPVWPFGSPRSYGAPGAGGSLGFADPATGIGYGYVTNRMGVKLDGDPRDRALRDALSRCL
jgi:CubicO group peptidase (beta-lactamase class C family)